MNPYRPFEMPCGEGGTAHRHHYQAIATYWDTDGLLEADCDPVVEYRKYLYNMVLTNDDPIFTEADFVAYINELKEEN